MKKLPEPTRADLSKWERLIAEAARIGAAPDQTAGDLAAAEKSARRGVVPWGELTKANPFVRLVRLAQQFVGETAAGRRALAPALAGSAAECRPLLDQARTRLTTPPAARVVRLPYAED